MWRSDTALDRLEASMRGLGFVLLVVGLGAFPILLALAFWLVLFITAILDFLTG